MIFKGQIFRIDTASDGEALAQARFPNGYEFAFKVEAPEHYVVGQPVTLLLEPDMDLDLKLAKAQKYDLLNTPEIEYFLIAVEREALHQRQRWGAEHDGGKTAADWFWLIGYLAGKALTSALTGDRDKALHHIITTAAACLNWHGAITGNYTGMRPGTSTKE